MDLRLSKTQKAVVDADSTPLLVIAGPGAGKTTVLGARIERLLNDTAGSYRKILGITYTNVAAKNLRTKLEEQSGEAPERVVVSTFHGFANKLLQQHGSHIGLRNDFSIANENEDRQELLGRAASSAGLSIEELSPRREAILRLLARLYERCLTADEARNLLDSDDAEVLALFDAYREQCIAEGQLEFSLLVHVCNRLLTQNKSIARQVRQVYEHICVDEFQDTNEMQYRLLDIIAADDARGLMLLADQDQVIYQWNGASPSRLSEAQKRFKMSVLLLPTSYRCPDNIVAAAGRLIANNATRFVSPEYDSERHASSDISVMSFADERLEAKWLGTQLTALDPSMLEDTVVLARSRRVLDVALAVSKEMGVAASGAVTKYDFESAPLVMLQSMLRLANQPVRQNLVKRIVTAFYVMTGREIDAEVLVARADERGLDPLVVFFGELLPLSSSEQFKKLARVVSEQLIPKKEFRGVSGAFFDWVNALPTSDLKVAYAADYEEEYKTWTELERRHQGAKADRVTLSELLRQIDLESKVKEPSSCVRFLTVHGAKGLEFERVFIIGAADGQFPAFQAVNSPQPHALEEERRSFFVAVTRTRTKLTISYAQRYFGYSAKPSMFIDEMRLP